MAVTKGTLRAILGEFGGLEMSDEELDKALPFVEAHLARVEKLGGLDLSKVLASRLLRAQEGESKNAN